MSVHPLVFECGNLVAIRSQCEDPVAGLILCLAVTHCLVDGCEQLHGPFNRVGFARTGITLNTHKPVRRADDGLDGLPLASGEG